MDRTVRQYSCCKVITGRLGVCRKPLRLAVLVVLHTRVVGSSLAITHTVGLQDLTLFFHELVDQPGEFKGILPI